MLVWLGKQSTKAGAMLIKRPSPPLRTKSKLQKALDKFWSDPATLTQKEWLLIYRHDLEAIYEKVYGNFTRR